MTVSQRIKNSRRAREQVLSRPLRMRTRAQASIHTFSEQVLVLEMQRIASYVHGDSYAVMAVSKATEEQYAKFSRRKTAAVLALQSAACFKHFTQDSELLMDAFKWDHEKSLRICSLHGYLDTLQHVLEDQEDLPVWMQAWPALWSWSRTLSAAAAGGHEHLLDWFLSKVETIPALAVGSYHFEDLVTAARSDYLVCIQKALQVLPQCFMGCACRFILRSMVGTQNSVTQWAKQQLLLLTDQ